MSRLRQPACLALAVTVAAACPLPGQAPKVGMSVGLQLVWASALAGEPDYETVITVLRTDSAEVRIRVSWNRGAEQRWRNAERPVSGAERRMARAIYFYSSEQDPREFRGATQSMVSAAVHRDLSQRGRADVVLLIPGVTNAPWRGTLERVGNGAEAFAVLLDERPVTLRGLRARGTLQGATSRTFELLVLDDPEAAWILEATNSDGTTRQGARRLVRVTTGARRESVGSDLETRCTVSIHDIHFASGSDLIDSTSSPALAGIARALAGHPDWRLTIVGHTDSIGTAAANLDLSRRRATRVRAALVAEHGAAAASLTADGRGEQEPIDDNGTVLGRARNRRVDLVRSCPK